MTLSHGELIIGEVFSGGFVQWQPRVMNVPPAASQTARVWTNVADWINVALICFQTENRGFKDSQNMRCFRPWHSWSCARNSGLICFQAENRGFKWAQTMRFFRLGCSRMQLRKNSEVLIKILSKWYITVFDALEPTHVHVYILQDVVLKDIHKYVARL